MKHQKYISKYLKTNIVENPQIIRKKQVKNLENIVEKTSMNLSILTQTFLSVDIPLIYFTHTAILLVIVLYYMSSFVDVLCKFIHMYYIAHLGFMICNEVISKPTHSFYADTLSSWYI